MEARKLGIAILVLIGSITASFVIAEMKNGLSVGNADAAPMGGNILYVGGSGANNYTKIQDAIDNASDGDTIFVYNGIYYENVVVNKRINLIGEDRDTTIIDGGRGGEDVVCITAKRVNVSGFMIKNASGWGAGVNIQSNYNNISGNNITSTNWVGIYLYNCSNNTIYNNYINSHAHQGILTKFSTDNNIRDNNISGNWGDGMLLDSSSNISITGNYITANYRGGILLDSSSNISITGNYITANWWEGIYLESSTNNLIKDNKVSNNSGGVGIDSATKNTIINNHIVSNDWHGVCLTSSSENNTILYNIISNNTRAGIEIISSNNNTFTNNSFLEDGLFVESSYHNTVINNTVNGKPLVYLENRSNQVVDDSAGQIVLVNCDNITVQNQNISNTTIGIELFDTNSCAIYKNEFSDSLYGLYICYSSNNNLLNNTITHNFYGMHFQYSVNNTISGNNIFNNAQAGIWIQSSNNSNISGNTFTNSTAYGLLLYLSLNTIVSNNIFHGDGLIVFNSGENNVSGNIVNGKPLVYLENRSNQVVDDSAGQIVLVNCDNITVKNQNLSNTDAGIEMINSSNCVISNNEITHNAVGILCFLSSLSNNRIYCNNIDGNSDFGIYNEGTGIESTIDASLNYWGSSSGPYHPTLNPNGTGDNVSDNVNFIPWLTAPVKGGKEESVEEGENEIDAVDEADTSLEINTTTNNTVRVISYEESPVEEPNVVKSTGKYVQVEVENKTNVEWPMAIKIYYTQEDLNNAGLTEGQIIGVYFYNESSGEWQIYNDTGVNTTDIIVNGKQYAGYAWANAWHLTNITIGADNTKPEISNVETNPVTQEVNGHVNISCIVTDNIKASEVFVNITYPDLTYHNFSMTNINGTNTYYYSASYSSEGNYEFFIWANDTSGNENISSKKSFSIFVPQCTLATSVDPSGSGSIILNPSGGTYDEGTVVTITAVANTGYEFDHWSGDVSGTSSSIQITMDSNKSITAHFSTIPSPPSNERPTVAITYPSNGSMVSGTISIAGTASDADGTVQSVQIKIDTGSWIEATGTTSWSYSWDTTAVANGSHTIYARSYDGTDYSSIDSVTVNVNNIPPNHKPTVKIISPDDGTEVKKTFTIHGTASDEDGSGTLQKVEIKIGDGEWKVVEGTTSWNYTWDSTSVDNGNYTLQARAYDGQEYSNIDSIMVKVNNGKGGGGGIPGFEMVALIVALGAVLWVRKKKK